MSAPWATPPFSSEGVAAVISVFSFVVLGVNAHYLSTVMKLASQAGVELPAQATAFSALGLAVAVITIVTLPAM